MRAFYMFRLYASVFRGDFRGTPEAESHVHESPAAMTIPLVVLAILAAVAGFLGIPEVFMKDSHALEHFLAPIFDASKHFQHSHPAEPANELMLMGVSVGVALIASIWAWNRFSKKPDLAEPGGISKVLANKWYVDEFYDTIIVRPLNVVGDVLDKAVERSGIDWLVNGVGRAVQYGSRQLRLLQSGQVGIYVLLMIGGMILLFVLQFFLKK